MRLFMWIVMVGATCISLLIGCQPSTATAASQVEIQQWGSGSNLRMPVRICDTNGVCCYHVADQGISCVATQITITVKHEDLINGSKYRDNSPQVERGARVLGQSLLGGPWESH